MSVDAERVVFPDHFGLCEGVMAADQLLWNVAETAHAYDIDTVYGYHGIAHNDDLISLHAANGVEFVDDLDEIPPQSVVVTSAHGVGPEVTHALNQKEAAVFDAACPLVIHTHRAAARARVAGEHVLYVCQKPEPPKVPHDEVLGMMGHLEYELTDGRLQPKPVEHSLLSIGEQPELPATNKFRIVTQTTLHADRAYEYVDQLKEHITSENPNAEVNVSAKGDVCRAVQDRQAGVEQLVQIKPKKIVVVTDPTSKNGRGYVDLAHRLIAEAGTDTTVHAVAKADEACLHADKEATIGITASASTPDFVTFAVAKTLGLKGNPQMERRPFRLADAQPESMTAKIRALAERRQQRG